MYTLWSQAEGFVCTVHNANVTLQQRKFVDVRTQANMRIAAQHQCVADTTAKHLSHAQQHVLTAVTYQMLIEAEHSPEGNFLIQGWPALHTAVKRGHVVVSNILLENGADTAARHPKVGLHSTSVVCALPTCILLLGFS